MEILDAIRAIERSVIDGGSFETLTSLIDAAEQVAEKSEDTQLVLHWRLTAATMFRRPLYEVERALREFLACETDASRRLGAAGAVYADYADLREYFDREVSNILAQPPSDVRSENLAWIDRVRANVRRKFGPDA